jgi:hypothetical protein
MYNLNGLQINRGTYNSQQISGNLTSCNHSYKSETDTVVEILMSGYFPVDFNVDTDDIKVGDLLWVVGTDGFSITKITSLNPVTLMINPASNVFPSGITTSSIDFINGGGFIDFFAATNLPVSWSGPWTSPINLSSGIRGYVVNDLCTLVFIQIPFITATSSSIITLADPLPEDFNPDSDKSFGPYLMVSNSIRVAGTIHITSAGVVTISSNLDDSGVFTGPGAAGFYTISVTFNIND